MTTLREVLQQADARRIAVGHFNVSDLVTLYGAVDAAREQVFAQNDEMALDAERAIEEAGLKNVAIVGFDATPDGVAAVKAGKLAASVQQKPELIGKVGVDAAKLLIEGKPVDRNIPVPLALVTQ